MYMKHLSSILAYLCISITQISFHQFFQRILLNNVQTHNYPTRNAQDYSINKTKKMFSDYAIRNCGPSFLEFSGQNCKTMQNHQTLPKSAEISFIVWIQLISFWGMSCVFLCIFVCEFVMCILVSLCIVVVTFVRAWLSQAFFGLLIMSSISCCVLFFYAFVLMYDIGIKFDMIWYDMIWYDMIWYDMIWYDMIPLGHRGLISWCKT